MIGLASGDGNISIIPAACLMLDASAAIIAAISIFQLAMKSFMLDGLYPRNLLSAILLLSEATHFTPPTCTITEQCQRLSRTPPSMTSPKVRWRL